MRGKRVLGEISHRRSFSKTTKRVNNGKVKGTPENVVLIDLDDDNVVIIDDAPESSRKNFGATGNRGKSSVEGVIHIDDDDDDDVDGDDGDDEASKGSDVELVSDASSSKTRFPTFKSMGRSEHKSTDEFEFVKEKTTAFHFSKCKQTYCTKSPAKNRYGLDPTFDYHPTDSDSSDCEIVSDSHGKLREQWEKASLKKRKHVRNRCSGLEDQSSASATESNNKARTNFVNGKQHCSSSNTADCMKENRPEFVATDDGFVQTPPKTSPGSTFVDVDKKSKGKSKSVMEKEPIRRNKDFQPGGASVSGHGHYSDVPQTNEDAFDGIPGHSAQESPFRPFEQEVGDIQASPPRACSAEKDNLDSRQAFVPNARLFFETQIDGAGLPDENFGHGSDDILSRSEDSYGKDGVRVDSEGAAVHNSACDRPSSNLNESSFMGLKEPNGNTECARDVSVDPPVETCIVTDRETFKSTDEFKRAMEEEWESRRRELEIQAEEVKKLRKRKKAESMRLNDIERRQKQRVEEVRETQKKNAEDINLKEQIRGEIRKEINKLEITCIDMASLLRGLGVPVNGGFNPMSRDVSAAYKRALLKFHPDRASREDIRQQVEAEEKFKLISRMKEKFLTSCC